MVFTSYLLSQVYEGSWNGREVAIKTLRKRHDEAALAEFEQEANIMKELQHTNVVQLLGVVMTQNPPLVIMELMGACFLDLLKRCQLSEKDVLDCGMQVGVGDDGCALNPSVTQSCHG